jgi:hypothetical protein
VRRLTEVLLASWARLGKSRTQWSSSVDGGDAATVVRCEVLLTFYFF